MAVTMIPFFQPLQAMTDPIWPYLRLVTEGKIEIQPSPACGPLAGGTWALPWGRVARVRCFLQPGAGGVRAFLYSRCIMSS
jgi:hypothetical protein